MAVALQHTHAPQELQQMGGAKGMQLQALRQHRGASRLDERVQHAKFDGKPQALGLHGSDRQIPPAAQLMCLFEIHGVGILSIKDGRSGAARLRGAGCRS